MRLFSIVILALASLATAAPPILRSRHDECRPDRIAVRKEWGSLSRAERLDYVNSVLCLMEKPSQYPPGVVPGAKSRFGDFVATHINNTMTIHLSGIFLAWHRHFVYLWEKALREECGYQGYQPYWDWALWCNDLSGSPLFDGSPTSLGSDGYYDPSVPGLTLADGTLPQGTGGGCIMRGPFSTAQTTFGPFPFDLVFTGGVSSNWTDYVPHCQTRDLSNWISCYYGNQTAIDRVMNTTTIEDFQFLMSGVGINTSGPHGGGHYSTGWPMADFFMSPSAPEFMLHHGMIDRMWTQWQAVDPANRQNAINGSYFIFYAPTAPEVTLDSTLQWGILTDWTSKEMWELMDAKAGPYCYTYE